MCIVLQQTIARRIYDGCADVQDGLQIRARWGKEGCLDESAKDSGAVPSGATRIGQILTGGATSEQQGNTTSEDEEYNLHAVESFIQSLNS